MELNIFMITIFNVTIRSKNKVSINHFFWFFKKYLIFSSNSINKYYQKKISIKRITLLKSPHVNKKAQEQFETIIFKKHFKILIKKNSKLLLFLKKISYNAYSDINIKIKELLNSSNFFVKKKLKIISLNNFKVNMYCNIFVKAKNFRFKKGLNFWKKNNNLNYIISKKINKLFFALQF